MTAEEFNRLYYFSIDFPGLTASDAERVVDLVEEQGLSGFVVDPVDTLVMGLDVDTVSALRAALLLASAADGLSSLERTITSSMVEHFSDWLDARAGEVRQRPDA